MTYNNAWNILVLRRLKCLLILYTEQLLMPLDYLVLQWRNTSKTNIADYIDLLVLNRLLILTTVNYLQSPELLRKMHILSATTTHFPKMERDKLVKFIRNCCCFQSLRSTSKKWISVLFSGAGFYMNWFDKTFSSADRNFCTHTLHHKVSFPYGCTENISKFLRHAVILFCFSFRKHIINRFFLLLFAATYLRILNC